MTSFTGSRCPLSTRRRNAAGASLEYTPAESRSYRAARRAVAGCEQGQFVNGTGRLRRDGETLQAHRLAGHAANPCDPSGVVARVQRRRRTAIGRAGRALRDVAEDVDMAERDVVIGAGLDLSRGDRRGTDSVGVLGGEAVRQRAVP